VQRLLQMKRLFTLRDIAVLQLILYTIHSIPNNSLDVFSGVISEKYQTLFH
jgi:hypothetical protein